MRRCDVAAAVSMKTAAKRLGGKNKQKISESGIRFWLADALIGAMFTQRVRLVFLPFFFLLAAVPVGSSQEFTAGDWGFRVENGSAHISSYTGAGGDVLVPGELEGFPVTSVGGFEGNHSITSVHIPDGVTTIEERAFASCLGLTSVTIPSTITNLGAGTFYLCTSLESVSIPDLTNLSGGATVSLDGTFFDCAALTNVSLGRGVDLGALAFWGCSSLRSVTLPETVTGIPDGAFGLCTNLTNVVVADGAGDRPFFSIGPAAFSDCRSLQSFEVPRAAAGFIGEAAFNRCSALTNVVLNEGVERIESVAFGDCTSLTSLTLPSSVGDIGSGAFAGCTNLSSININAPAEVTDYGVVTIDGVVFSVIDGRRILLRFPPTHPATSYTVPEGVVGIDYDAFVGCTRLTNIVLPASLQSIDIGGANPLNPFSGCANLARIEVHPANLAFASVDGILFGKGEGNTLDTLLRMPPKHPAARGAYRVPDQVQQIAYAAFEGCGELTSLNMGPETYFDDATFMSGADALAGCAKLTAINSKLYSSLNGILFAPDNYGNERGVLLRVPPGLRTAAYRIPAGVTEIADYAFAGCRNLQTVSIPPTVTRIGKAAFAGCASLESVFIPASVTDIDQFNDGNYGGGYGQIFDVFAGCTSLRGIYVDRASKSFASLGGVLFNRDFTILMRFPPRSPLANYNVPAGVRALAEGSFDDCANLASIYLPDGLAEIGLERGLNEYQLGFPFGPFRAGIFGRCAQLRSIVFLGDSPLVQSASLTVGHGWVSRNWGADQATVFFTPGSSGWGKTFGGRPTQLLSATGLKSQSISFFVPLRKVYPGSTLPLLARASSRLPVSYVVSDPEVARLEGSSVRILKPVPFSVTARQMGNEVWAPASRTVTISPLRRR